MDPRRRLEHRPIRGLSYGRDATSVRQCGLLLAQETVEERVRHLTMPLMAAREHVVTKVIFGPQRRVHSSQLSNGLPGHFNRENRIVNAAFDEHRSRRCEGSDVEVLQPTKYSGEHLRATHVEGDSV